MQSWSVCVCGRGLVEAASPGPSQTDWTLGLGEAAQLLRIKQSPNTQGAMYGNKEHSTTRMGVSFNTPILLHPVKPHRWCVALALFRQSFCVFI